jgi:hypothetical protein
VENPALFLKAVESQEQERVDQRLAAGPEGVWCKDLAVVTQILKRLLRQVPTLFGPPQDPLEQARLRQALAPTARAFAQLQQALAEAAKP